MDPIGCHIDIVTTPIKDFCEKCSDKIPHGTAMKLHRTDHAMVRSGQLHSGVAAIMKRIVALCREFPDGPFCQVIIDGEIAILKVGEYLIPKAIQVIQGLRVILTPTFWIPLQLVVQATTDPYHDLLGRKTLPFPQALLGSETGLVIITLIPEQQPHVINERLCSGISTMVGGLHKIVTSMRHTNLMDRVLEPGGLELVTDKHVCVRITQRVGRNCHTHVRQPLVKETKSHVLDINLISDRLKDPRGGLDALEPRHDLWMTRTGEITPLGLLSGFHIMHHLKAFLYQTSLQAEHLNGLTLYDTTGYLRQIRGMQDRITYDTHGLICVRAT